MFHRWTHQWEQESYKQSEDEPPATSSSDAEQSSPVETKADSSSKIDTLRSGAETGIETAVAARKSNDFDEAAEAYNKALTQYQNILNELDSGWSGSTSNSSPVSSRIVSVVVITLMKPMPERKPR